MHARRRHRFPRRCGGCRQGLGGQRQRGVDGHERAVRRRLRFAVGQRDQLLMDRLQVRPGGDHGAAGRVTLLFDGLGKRVLSGSERSSKRIQRRPGVAQRLLCAVERLARPFQRRPRLVAFGGKRIDLHSAAVALCTASLDRQRGAARHRNRRHDTHRTLPPAFANEVCCLGRGGGGGASAFFVRPASCGRAPPRGGA